MNGLSNKGALNLLCIYGGDGSSDDEVPGTRVSTKRMHKGSDDDNEPKHIKLIPVPDFVQLQIEQHDDDSDLHEGRLRSFPHLRGNWATYVYIPVELNEGVQRLIQNLLQITSINFQACSNFHLSLTRTVILKHHWIDLFVNSIREKISHFMKFFIMFQELEVYCNDEKSRTFIGIKVTTGIDTLLKLVKLLDNSLLEFNLPIFYENPSFHISLLWCLGDYYEEIKLELPKFNQILDNLVKKCSQDNWYKYVDQILCKTGNKVFQFNL